MDKEVKRPLDFIHISGLRINNEAKIILNNWRGDCAGFRYIEDKRSG
jgi:hypothetical protein